MDEKYLHNGIKLLKKRDFLEAINNFEEYIVSDNTNYIGFYYLGLAYIFRELYDEAYKYILKAYKLNENDVNTINTLAFLNLKYNNVDEAINYWLDVLDIDKKNYIVRRNLDKVKKCKNIQKLVNSASPDDFVTFKTKKSMDLPFKIPLLETFKINYIWLSVFIIITAGVVFFLFRYNIQNNNAVHLPLEINIKNLSNITLPDIEGDYIIDKSIKKSIFNLKADEIQILFYETKKHIQKQYFNKATININKILHSNAGIIIKKKFKILKHFIIPRQTFKLQDNISYSTLMNLPLLYEDIQIVWEGKMEDIELDEEEPLIVFNFFVKEKEQSIGVAKVFFKKLFTNLVNGKNVIISGKFIQIDKKSRSPIIEGISLKEL